MRKINFFLLCCFSTLAGFGQGNFFFGQYFFEYDTLLCPFDGNKTVVYPRGWYVYQTTDGAWDGPVDSTRCISVEPYGGQSRIDLDQIDPAEPLFIRAKSSGFAGLPDLPLNQLFNAFVNSYVSDVSAKPVLGTGCVQDLCTGIYIGIAVPGPMRIQTGVTLDWGPTETGLDLITCFPSEYFGGQQLNELILKYTFPATSELAGKYLHVQSVELADVFWPAGLVSEIDVDASHYNTSTGEYDINVAAAVTNGGFFFDNFILQYTAPTFPSVQDPSYVIGSVNPNSTEQEVINLVVDPFQVLEIQPFTYLAGALAAGSDTLRHQVNLVNNGGDICLNFVDFVVSDGDEFRHGGGSLYMNSAFSCMQFRDESALRVLEGATLHYGNNGTGMLALCAGSTIALERDATLIVDGILNMSECNDLIAPQQLYMDLPPGSKLVFTENARLTNRFSQGQHMLLNVRMLGGALDDGALAAEDRELIRRIYPEPSPQFADNVSFAPNPFAEVFVVQYVAGKTETVALRWTDISGRIAGQQTLHAVRGLNEWQALAPEAAGVYLLSVESEAGKLTKKVVKVGR